jgi:NADPH:quinone reductase-like Zn-dependent oxidoreductase
MEKISSKETMRAVRFHQYGGPEVLTIDQVEVPQPGPGQVLIAVEASAVNRIDAALRAGYYKDFMPTSFPAGVGLDGSGIVVAIGSDVSGVKIGDAVFGAGKDTAAEYAVLNEWVYKPESLSFEEAAGYITPVETATRVLQEISLKKGETLLVSGAAGSVGTALIQLAKAEGIHIIGTASEARHEFIRSLGATPTTYGPDLKNRVADLAPDGVQAAVDLAGSGIILELIEITGDAAKVLTIADLEADKYGIKGTFVPKSIVNPLEKALKMLDTGSFTLPVAQIFTMDQADKAQQISATGHSQGRLIIKIN